MPTAASWTDARRALADVGHLLWLRRRTAGRRPHRVLGAILVGLLVGVTVATVWLPATFHQDHNDRAFDLLLLMPALLAGFAGLTAVSAAAAGGGRELLARDPAAIHPISPTTDHLGALLLAPLNIAWILQVWGLLGATSFAVGTDHLVRGEIIMVLWIVAATALGQVVSWTLEGVRRLRHGIATLRVLAVVLLLTTLGLQAADLLTPVIDRLPTARVVAQMITGWSLGWWLTVLGLVVATLFLIALGAVPARWAARHTPHDELRVETGNHTPRPDSRWILGALIRTDRASVWRAVPMRRGLLVLALGPGLVAVLGGLDWETMTILPGLVASGGALLYGVNAWCLDGRGVLWRESLPVAPGRVFDSRAYVLGEFLTVGSLATVLLGLIRAGVPAPSELMALLCAIVVVTVQVVGAAMRWSIARPFAVDMRSARATPAPPAVMVGYSARLALSTTMVGLIFSFLSRLDEWSASVLIALVMAGWSGGRLLLTRRDWVDPYRRVRVTTTVVGA